MLLLRPNCPRFARLILPCGLALLAHTAFGHGNVHDQIEALSQRIAASGGAGLRLERAGLLRLDGDIDRALADIETAADIDPQIPRIDLLRAQLLHDAGLSRTSLIPLNRYLSTHPDQPDALLLRAKILTHLCQGEDAADDYTRAIDLLEHPGPDLFLERANALLGSPDPDIEAALHGLDEGIQALGPIPALQQRAVELELAHANTAGALARLQTLIDRSPANPQLLLQKGDVLRGAGDAVLAQTAYREASERIAALPQTRRDIEALQTSLKLRLAELEATP